MLPWDWAYNVMAAPDDEGATGPSPKARMKRVNHAADCHQQWIASNVLECGLCGDRSVVMSSPASTDRDDLIRALAKQAYRHELLVKTLRARGYLPAREPESLETVEDFDSYLKIFRLYFSRKRRPSESGES